MSDELLRSLGISEEEIAAAKKVATKDIKNEIGVQNKKSRGTVKKPPKIC